MVEAWWHTQMDLNFISGPHVEKLEVHPSKLAVSNNWAFNDR
jgi:hypothetical protein